MLAQACRLIASRSSDVPKVLGGSARYAAAATGAPSNSDYPTEEDLRTKSVCTILAEMMHKEATKAKKAEALKADVAKIVELLDSDISKYPELGTQGKFKDYLEKMDPLLRNQLFTVILQSEAMQKAQPMSDMLLPAGLEREAVYVSEALKEVVAQLQLVGEPSSIVEVAHRYMKLVEKKETENVSILGATMTVAKEPSEQEFEILKFLLVEDMYKKGKLKPKTAKNIQWTVKVDPKILGGVIYQIGDLLLDVSFHTLQSEFFQELENAGIKPIL